MIPDLKDKEDFRRMQAGELYDSFAPDLLAARRRCARVYRRFNNCEDPTRRQMVEFWKQYANPPWLLAMASSAQGAFLNLPNRMTFNDMPLPPPAATQEMDEKLLQEYPCIERPIRLEYGFNIKTGSNVFIDSNCIILDTGKIYIGSRTKIGPNVSLFGATHLVDPSARNGMKGGERGGDITIGDDCWIGGNVTILHDVTIGEGCTIGAGSVVTKDIPPYCLAVGNPAKVIREIGRMESKGDEMR